ncbi:7-cyano-7-deazaguanine synthase QueC [Pseudonocardia sp. ICBG1293]|uniref:7-cyano-7-deazaguanine synthase QueC n=1 Tax=Pseudonocardia sp. ICBG1293 TaxID=2844382 RepID=UPI001CCFB20A|nr:7-cyano-7-deazaguanine synthase QueC [Pseudonocardia sp. ICBG1293]
MVSLSGGQDSGTCLFWAQSQYEHVEAVSLDYGQRHRIELDCATRLADIAGVTHTVLQLGSAFRQIGSSSLTDESIDSRWDATGTGNHYAARHGLPSSFVPGRNVVLLGYGAAHAVVRGATTLITGVCSTDEAGYPDCRITFIRAYENALREALAEPGFQITAPLLDKTKSETWKLAHQLGCVNEIIEHTHSCYHGDRNNRFDWGYGCGQCPACTTRATGWTENATTRRQSHRENTEKIRRQL